MRNYDKDILSTSARHVEEIICINKELTEKTLRMRCLSYMSQVKAQLLTQTIFEIESSKKYLRKINVELEYRQGTIVSQHEEMRRKNLQLEQVRNELEQRVKERTVDLEEMNQKLQIEIEERKQAEEELTRYQEHLQDLVDERTKELRDSQKELLKKEKFAAIGRISGSIAHDIRHPLATIKNSVYFLKVTLNDPDEKTKKHLKLIDGEINHANDIITGMKRLSEYKKTEKRRTNINDFVNEFIATFPLPKRIKLTTELDNECPDIMIDRFQLKQVFANIASNAVHAIPENGELIISTKLVGNFTEIKFTDTGGGMKKDILDKIFEPFFTTSSSGMGIGLSIVKDIIAANDGNISVESEEGKGSTFKMVFKAVRD